MPEASQSNSLSMWNNLQLISYSSLITTTCSGTFLLESKFSPGCSKMSSCIYQLTFRQLIVHSVQLSKNEKVFLGIRKEQLHLLKLMWIASLIPQALCETDSSQHVVTKSCSVRAKAKFMKTPKRSHSSSSSSWIFVQDKCNLVLSWYGCCQANLILEAFAGCEQTPEFR